MYLKENGASDHSVARKNSALRLFFKHLRMEQRMQHNPMEDIKQPAVRKRLSEVTSEDIKSIREAVINAGNPRDILLFNLMLNDGVKPSEILGRQKKHYKNGILYTDKKAILLSEQTKLVLRELLEEKEEKDWILCNQHGHPLKESGTYFIIKSYLNGKDLRPIDLVKKLS